MVVLMAQDYICSPRGDGLLKLPLITIVQLIEIGSFPIASKPMRMALYSAPFRKDSLFFQTPSVAESVSNYLYMCYLINYSIYFHLFIIHNFRLRFSYYIAED
jgi:hypothetical protein